jgi:hypothetical protein
VNSHSAQPLLGAAPRDAVEDRALITDLLGSEAAGLVANVPLAELLDADVADWRTRHPPVSGRGHGLLTSIYAYRVMPDGTRRLL